MSNIKITCPHCLREFERRESLAKTQARRRKLIVNNLSKKMLKTQFYKSCRIQGYPMRQRTFDRDLQVLEESGYLRIQIAVNEPKGVTSYVVPIRGENCEEVHM